MSNQIIQNKTADSKKTKLFQRYEKLLEDISIKKLHQDNLTEGMRIVIPRLQSELHPLLKKQAQYQINKIIRLDEVVDQIVISKTKFLIFKEYILEELEELLKNSEKDNDILKALYLKYYGEKFEQVRIEQDFISELVKSKFGINVDPDEIIKKGFKRFIEENQEKFQSHFGHRVPKKKSKKQTKKQKEEKEEEKTLALDAKAIYFRLIKKYHPDRQLDPNKQNEFTEITKLVTKAYKENDFMALLKLQITYLEENELEATALADDMLLRYNKILQTQLKDLNEEITYIKRNSNGLFEDFFDSNYSFSNALFTKHKLIIKGNIENLKNELEYSNQQKKGWFKECLKQMEAKIEHKNLRFHIDSI
jgi:Trp operon repressor